jgi:subtilisin-like proprotein convertase family protein
MHARRARKHSALWRVLPAIVLLALAAACWWLNQPDPQPPAGAPGRHAAATRPVPDDPSGAAAALRRPPVHKPGAGTRPAPQLVPVRPSLERGPNQRLVFEDPREVVRHAVRGRLFAEPLLAIRPRNPLGPLTVNDHTRSAVEAAHDPAVIPRFLASAAGALTIPLDRKRSVIVDVDRVITRGPVTHTLVGKVRNDAFSEVLLVFHDGAVSGSVAFLDRDVHYEFGMAGNGDVAIRNLDPASYHAPCGDPGEPPHADADEPRDLPAAPDGLTPESAGEPAAATVVIDTVVGYDMAARIADGGVAAIEARIIASVDGMNAAFTNSLITGVAVALRATVEDPDYQFPGDLAGDLGSSDELGHLAATSDGVLDTISNLRIQLGADHNAFVVAQADGSAGIAYRPGNSMIVARDYMTSTRLTFAHEFGHNIGARHGWGDTAGETSTANSNYGWRLDPPGSALPVRTIMAYDWGWGTGARIPYYSNPAVEYNGARTGATDGYDASGDPTADPRCVAGGYIGTAGSGYDGTNPLLGARNADFLAANAPSLADNANRPAPDISVEHPAGTALPNGAATVSFSTNAVGSATTRTFTIRNAGTLELNQIAVGIDGPASAEFAVSPPAATLLAPGATTTFVVTFTPTAFGIRSAAIQITSNDTDESPFVLDLTGYVAMAHEFAGRQMVKIASLGTANPYPATIEVAGISETVSGLRVRLNGLSHTFPDDLDVFLMAPDGTVCALMSDAGGGNDLVNVDLTLDDRAANTLPNSTTIVPGSYRPINHSTSAESPPPGTAGTIKTSLAALVAGEVNGTWKLFVTDDSSSDLGSIGSWTLEFELVAPPPSVESLAVTSPHGNPAPAAGEHLLVRGSAVTAAVSSPEVAGGTRYWCTGWTGTGSVPPAGTGTTTTFTIAASSSITWTWNTQHWLELEVAGSGSVDAGDDWLPEGEQITLTATAGAGQHFVAWTGDTAAITAGERSSPQITIRIEGPVALTANFAPDPQPELALEETPDTTLANGAGIDFGDRVIGLGATWRTFTLRNHGSAPLDGISLDRVGAAGSSFVLDATAIPAGLAPGDAATFRIGFAPLVEGQWSAAVRITTNAQSNIPFELALTGTGLTPRQAFDRWTQAEGLTGDDALPEAHPPGVATTNLVRYAFNLHRPAAADPTMDPATDGSGMPVITRTGDPGTPLFRLEFRRRKYAGLIYTPMISSALAPPSWVAITSPPRITDLDDHWERATIEHPYDPAAPAALFTVQVSLSTTGRPPPDGK